MGESAFDHRGSTASRRGGLAEAVGREPTPEFAAQFVDEFDHRIRQLADRGLQEIAVRKMEGYTNAEIAGQRGCTERTVQRKLQLIRKIWESG